MSEFFDRYYPTLCVRRAEMTGMEKLPDVEKSKMLPIVLLAPWLNSIKFENTFDRVEQSIGNHKIIVDLDRYYQSDSTRESRVFFNSLLKGDDAHLRWIDLIQAHEHYIPCIQIYEQTVENVECQIDAFKELARGFVFRFETQRHYDFKNLESIIGRHLQEDMLFVFDTGWGEFSDTQIFQVTKLIEWLTHIQSELKFVISGSNFPNSFTDFENVGSLNIGTRQLYEALSKQFDNYQMYYGDWASTKPRTYDGGGNAPIDRIDFPTKDRWIISRSKDEEWDFEDAAKRVVRLTEWEQRPHVWGTGMIEKTAKGLPGSISTGPQAIAARVNIHLFMQNNFTNDNIAQINTDGQWVDPI